MIDKKFSKVWWIVLAVVILVVAGWKLTSGKLDVDLPESQEYQSTETDRRVVKIADGMGLMTRVKLTPNNQLMLVTNLTGDLFALVKNKTGWVRQKQLVYHVDHNMNPAGENGMTGLIISSEYQKNHFIFLTYTQKQVGGRGENTVLRLRIDQVDGRYVGVEPMVIFQGNTLMLGAHQIQGGTGVTIEGKPHLLFAIGEGYQEQHARNLQYEAGKLMLIQEDGSNPLGTRPYPEFPKIQVIGIRNVYDVALDAVNKDWIYFTHNGPNANDTIIHAPIFDGRRYDFNWQSEDNPATMLIPLVNEAESPEYVIRNWEVTVSPTDIVSDTDGTVYFNIFSSSRYPKKEVVRGRLTHNKWSWEVVVERKSESGGGNLLGLTFEKNGTLFFGDMNDGAVYQLR